MRGSAKLGRVFGIDIQLHYSWIIVALLVVFSLGGHFALTNPQWSGAEIWLLAGITAVLFFVSILVHEFSHSIVARGRGLPVRSITLFALGGLATTEKDSTDAKSEFWIAFVGPLTSIILGVLFLILAEVSGWRIPMATPPSPLWAGFVWLGYINIALGIFNLIPGYPLDGGRILRALAWAVTGSIVRATQIAARVGQFVAMLFIAYGLIQFFTSAGFGGIWLAFIGWFLLQAASASLQHTAASVALVGIRVRDVMTEDFLRIRGDLDLRTFAEHYLLRSGRRCFIAVDEGRDAGVITIDELKRVPRHDWTLRTVLEAARPIHSTVSVCPDMTVMEALELMAREDVSHLPVVSHDGVAGIISRSNVMQFLRMQEALKAA